MATMSEYSRQAARYEVKVFGERLIRIFKRNQEGEPCKCGRPIAHAPDCPQHVWEIAAKLTQMELDDTL
jgi:hypothetical protein